VSNCEWLILSPHACGHDQRLADAQAARRGEPVRFGEHVPQAGIAPHALCDALQTVAGAHRVERSRARLGARARVDRGVIGVEVGKARAVQR
jgi:hypothetical protein